MKQTRKRRILIVDDSKMNREILTGILEDEYDIVEAEDILGMLMKWGSVIISADLLMQGLLTPECATRSHFLNEIILIR